MIGERYAPLGARQMFDGGRRYFSVENCHRRTRRFLRSYLLERRLSRRPGGTEHRQLRGPSRLSQTPDALGDSEQEVIARGCFHSGREPGCGAQAKSLRYKRR